MERQVATERKDRPHGFVNDGEDLCDICTKPADDPLHSQQARELASEHGSPMPRIIGS